MVGIIVILLLINLAEDILLSLLMFTMCLILQPQNSQIFMILIVLSVQNLRSLSRFSGSSAGHRER